MNNEKFNKLPDFRYCKVLDLYKFLNTKEFFELAKRMGISNVKIYREGEILKLRMWKSNWQLPKEIKVQSKLIKYGYSRQQQNIIKRVLYARIEKFEEFKKRWSKKEKSPKYWGESRCIPFYEENGYVWIKLHDNWFFCNIVPKPEDLSFKDNWLYYKIPKNLLGVSYTSSGDNLNLFILIPSGIETDDFFFEGLGLQQGDGTHSLSDVHITFTNGCLLLIEHQLDWFNKLGIDINAIRIYPEIPVGMEENFNITKKKLTLKGIQEIQFRKKKGKLTNTKNILIQLVFHNRLFKLFYLHLLYNSREIILTDKNNTISYMRGIFASEGSVKVRKECGLFSAIKISASPEDTRNFYKKCLVNIGIISSKDEMTKGSEAIMISRLENYKKILEMNLLDLHPEKQEKFINTLKNYQNNGGIKDE